MTAYHLLHELENYHTSYTEEAEFLDRFRELVRQHPEMCYRRELLHAHITGSAWIINQAADKVLLTHHHKLDKWLQPGGHADGDTNILNVSAKEAEEETGLQELTLVGEGIFDLDIHRIPARKNEPAHFHFDVRYLFRADENAPLVVTRESKDLAWVPLEEVGAKSDHNRSMLRMVEKTQSLKTEYAHHE